MVYFLMALDSESFHGVTNLQLDSLLLEPTLFFKYRVKCHMLIIIRPIDY